MALITAKIVRQFIDSYSMKEEFRDALLVRLNSLTGGQDGILAETQLNDIFEGSPSLKAAFLKSLESNS